MSKLTQAADLTRDDLLTLLIEECAEVIQASTKCQRFGFNADHGVDYGRNDKVLAGEMGDLQAIIDEIMVRHMLRDAQDEYRDKQAGKIAKALRAKSLYGQALREQS